MGRGDNMKSVIGEGSAFKGVFKVQGALWIDGKFEGEINAGETLTIGPTGRVRTNIVAKRVIVAGTLIGDIHASEEVYLEASGRILGSIRAPVIRFDPGVVVKGIMEITGGQKKELSSVVKDSYQGGPPLPGKIQKESEKSRQNPKTK